MNSTDKQNDELITKFNNELNLCWFLEENEKFKLAKWAEKTNKYVLKLAFEEIHDFNLKIKAFTQLAFENDKDGNLMGELKEKIKKLTKKLKQLQDQIDQFNSKEILTKLEKY